MEKGYKDLKVYQMAYALAKEIFEVSKLFPKEETYSLTDQIRRSSRSVTVNIGEAYRKRRYPKHFTSKITDADGECTETQIWLDHAFDCNYIKEELKNKIQIEYQEVGRMLGGMAENPLKFLPKKKLPPATATAATVSSTTATATAASVKTTTAAATAAAAFNSTGKFISLKNKISS